MDPCLKLSCAFGEQCVIDEHNNGRCECPKSCPLYGDTAGSRPVCGDDGVDYANICELHRLLLLLISMLWRVQEPNGDICEIFSGLLGCPGYPWSGLFYSA